LKGHKRIVSEIQHTPLPRTNEVVAWIEAFVSLMGDKMPDCASIHLPSSVSKVSIYQRMVAELKARGKIDIISPSQLFGAWKTYFCRVTIPKKNRFTNVMCVFLSTENWKGQVIVKGQLSLRKFEVSTTLFKYTDPE
jgi:hypothetical protein